MPFQSAPNIAEAVVVSTVNGVQNLMVLNFLHVGGAYDQNDIDTLAAEVDGWMGAELLPNLANTLAYNETRVKGLTSATDLFAANSTNAGGGGIGAIPFPNNVTFAIKHTSSMTGRSARGRTYVPGIPAAAGDTNENFLQVTVADNLAGAFNALRVLLLTFDWAFGTLSRFTLNAPRVTGVMYLTVNSSYSDLRLDTQRRRLGN